MLGDFGLRVSDLLADLSSVICLLFSCGWYDDYRFIVPAILLEIDLG